MILGAILAGGQSRRFGADKATASWRGHSMVEHSATALAPFVDKVVVAGRSSAHDLESVADFPMPSLGPLGGVCGALRYAGRHGYDRVMTVACDTPILPRRAFERLLDAGAPAFVTCCPVLGFWPTSSLDGLVRHLIISPDRSIVGWAKHIDAVPIDAGVEIPNVNRPADLDLLDRNVRV